MRPLESLPMMRAPEAAVASRRRAKQSISPPAGRMKAWKAPLRSFTMRQSHRMARHLATERLIAFYESKNSQSQVGRVEEIIEKFEGRYDEIFAKLTRKYKGWV